MHVPSGGPDQPVRCMVVGNGGNLQREEQWDAQGIETVPVGQTIPKPAWKNSEGKNRR